MRGYKTKEQKQQEEVARIQKEERNARRKGVMTWIVIMILVVSWLGFLIGYKKYRSTDSDEELVIDDDSTCVDSLDTVSMDSVCVDLVNADSTVKACDTNGDQSEKYGAPLSEGEIEDGLGGFDDNAEGYFSMWADQYMDNNRSVYFEGYFKDKKGQYPISLKFEIDDDWKVETCYYHNINYNTKLKMNVRFTEEYMFIRGNAGGCDFTIKLYSTENGCWRGTARNGSKSLDVYIKPMEF